MSKSRIKLFCFPYAGGSSFIYSKWQKYMDEAIEVIPVELAGRGKRIGEPLYRDLDDVVIDLFRLVKAQHLSDAPFLFFGHSMGALIAYELCQKLIENNLRSPSHVFFSGRGAPHVVRGDKEKIHLMDESEFKKAVFELGGTPPEVFNHPELVDFYMPILRSDFKIAESVFARPQVRRLETDITVFIGKDEDLTPEQCAGWKNHTSKACTVNFLNGGHFFLHDEVQAISRTINSVVSDLA